MKSIFCAILAVITVKSDAAKILAVYPTPSISHQVVFRPLMLELAKRGHEVVVITTDPLFPKGKTPANFTEIDVHDLSYSEWRKKFVAITADNDLTNQMRVGFSLITDIFVEQMKTAEVQKLLKEESETFDLVFLEALLRPALILSHVVKAPVIQISSFGAAFGNFEVIGAPVHPLLYPTIFRQKLTNLSVWDKVDELNNHYKFIRWHNAIESYENEVLKEVFGKDIPDLATLKDNVDMLFLNVNPIFEGNRPVPPGVIYMGGLHQKPEKELPKDLQSYLDSSTEGVIYVSFGTNVNPSQLPPEKIQTMVNVFSKLPYNVLWKWDKDVLPGRTENIKLFKWLPQSDLLRHPNIKLFITQGGLQSTDEAITAGVPLIGIPMLADQWYNVEKYIVHGIGVRLDMSDVNEAILENAIKKVIGDKSYRNNILRLRTLVQDQPQTPLERAVWWTEYTIRHKGAKHLRSPAANITWSKFLELDLICTLLSMTIGFIIAISLAVYYSVKMYRSYTVNIKLKKS